MKLNLSNIIIKFFIIASTLFLSSCRVNKEIQGSSGNSDQPSQNLPVTIDINSLTTLVNILDSDTLTVQVKNTSSQTLSDFQWNNENLQWQIQNSSCPSQLPPGQNCSFTVLFTSNGDDVQNHTLELSFKQGSTTVSKNISVSAGGSIPGNVNVEKVYPSFGANWNDYVKVTDFSKKNYLQEDVDCATPFDLGSAFNNCVHGGERLKVRTGQSSCDNLTLEETLNVFNWACDASSGEAYFYSIGLKIDKGLSDLLDGSIPAFKNNSILIKKNGTTILTSSSSVWWQNDVQYLPDNSATSATNLSNATSTGTIYVINSDQNSKGYILDSNKIAIVTLNNSALKLNAAGTLVSTGYKYFLWFEGHFDGQNIASTGGISNMMSMGAPTCFFCQFVNLRISRFNGGVAFGSPGASRIRNLELSHNYIAGMSLATAWLGYDNIYYNLRLLNSIGTTDVLTGYVSNVILKFEALGNSGRIEFNFTNSSSLKNLMNYLGFSHINHSGNVRLNYMDGQTVSSFLGMNSFYAIDADDGISNSLFHNIAAINNSNVGLEFDPATGSCSNNKFTGAILMGGNTVNCSGAGTSGLIDGTCADANTDGNSSYTGQLSDAILRINKNLANTFFGKITTDDTINQFDTNGSGAFSSIPLLDFFRFDSPYRFWSKNHADVFPTVNHRGACVAGQTCRIWDFRIKNTDTAILNVSGDGASANDPFVADATCPSQVHGNEAISNLRPTPDVFLKNAMEIPFDDIGNDNGLCESNEACLYMPNIGAYQGHGDFSNNSCLFQDGTISGVKMYAHPNNGF